MPPSPAETPFQIRSARPEEAATLAEIMAEAIDWSRFKDLGLRFSTLVHRHMTRSRHCLCFVAVADGVILGFVAGTIDNRGFYREFLWRYGWRAALVLAPQLLRPARVRVILRGLTYFPESDRPEDPDAEALTWAVRAGVGQRGVGAALWKTLLDAYRERGITVVKMGTADPDNEVANRFFRSLGSELVRTDPFYRDTRVNVYYLRL